MSLTTLLMSFVTRSAGLPLRPGLALVPLTSPTVAVTCPVVMPRPSRNGWLMLVMSWTTVVIHGSFRSELGAEGGVHVGSGPA